MNSNDPADTPMSRLIRIETKLSSFIHSTEKCINKLEGKINHIQQTLDEVYPPEEGASP